MKGNKLMRVVTTISFCMLLCIACKHKEQGTAINNPALQEITIGQTTAIVRLLEQRQPDTAPSAADNGFCYFNVRFDNNTTDKLAKDKKLYLDFDMQQDFVMVTGLDTIPAAFCERIANGKRGNYEYILGFEKKGQADFEVLYKDKMFGMGIVGFVYKQSDLKGLPTIKPKLAG